jgi:hypothetical protein
MARRARRRVRLVRGLSFGAGISTVLSGRVVAATAVQPSVLAEDWVARHQLQRLFGDCPRPTVTCPFVSPVNDLVPCRRRAGELGHHRLRVARPSQEQAHHVGLWEYLGELVGQLAKLTARVRHPRHYRRAAPHTDPQDLRHSRAECRGAAFHAALRRFAGACDRDHGKPQRIRVRRHFGAWPLHRVIDAAWRGARQALLSIAPRLTWFSTNGGLG